MLETLLLKIHPLQPDLDIICQAAAVIRQGGLVAFPTETVYGLGANGLDGAAVERIFLAKGRPSDNPLILHVATMDEAAGLAREITTQARTLMERFWPGPLTLILPKKEHIPRQVTAGLDTVAIRMPDHPAALALIRAAGVPLAAPSANSSGLPSPTTADHVMEDLQGKIEMILDAGPAGLGLESTVVDMTGDVPVILRPGGITPEQIVTVLGQVRLDTALSDATAVPRAPGMKYRHYSPKARVILIDGAPAAIADKLKELSLEAEARGEKLGLLLTRETLEFFTPSPDHYWRELGSRGNLKVIAQRIYRELRACDQAGVDLILTETYPEEGWGLALMNRLLKAAGYHMIKT